MLSEIQEKIGLTVTQLYIVALVFVLASLSTHSLISYFRSSLRLLPGPFLARFSPLWCTYINIKGDTHREYQRLHKKYGPVVRTGPNTVSIGDAANIPEIYQQGHSYIKSNYLVGFGFTIDGVAVENMFTTTNPHAHKMYRQSVGSKYSMSQMLPMEPLIDQCMTMFIGHMERYEGSAINLGEWINWYTFDLTGLLTFKESFGFMKQERDINGVIAQAWTFLGYGIVIGQFPFLHKFLLGNPAVVDFLDKFTDSNPLQMIQLTAKEAMTKYDAEEKTGKRGDFLEYLRQKQSQDPEFMNDREIMSNILIFFIGAVDTNATIIRAIFYYLCKNPRIYAKLTAELREAEEKGHLSEFVSFQQAQKLPYLQAVVRETERIYPVIGQPLERVVPKDGAIFNGHFVPEGTVVGVNGWVTHFDKKVFGEDAEFFRPERWLEADEEKVRMMNKNMVAFGLGNRACIGRHIAAMVVTKTVAQMVRLFDMEWASEEEEWVTACRFQVRQREVIMRLKRRDLLQKA